MASKNDRAESQDMGDIKLKITFSVQNVNKYSTLCTIVELETLLYAKYMFGIQAKVWGTVSVQIDIFFRSLEIKQSNQRGQLLYLFMWHNYIPNAVHRWVRLLTIWYNEDMVQQQQLQLRPWGEGSSDLLGCGRWWQQFLLIVLFAQTGQHISRNTVFGLVANWIGLFLHLHYPTTMHR